LYNNPLHEREEVAARFPSAGTDIEEASKCLAFSRYATSVFHSLQVVEIGLIELGKVLVIKDPILGWTATTLRLKAILKARHPDRTKF